MQHSLCIGSMAEAVTLSQACLSKNRSSSLLAGVLACCLSASPGQQPNRPAAAAAQQSSSTAAAAENDACGVTNYQPPPLLRIYLYKLRLKGYMIGCKVFDLRLLSRMVYVSIFQTHYLGKYIKAMNFFLGQYGLRVKLETVQKEQIKALSQLSRHCSP